jgi:hypothetical protein
MWLKTPFVLHISGNKKNEKGVHLKAMRYQDAQALALKCTPYFKMHTQNLKILFIHVWSMKHLNNEEKNAVKHAYPKRE